MQILGVTNLKIKCKFSDTISVFFICNEFNINTKPLILKFVKYKLILILIMVILISIIIKKLNGAKIVCKNFFCYY